MMGSRNIQLAAAIAPNKSSTDRANMRKFELRLGFFIRRPGRGAELASSWRVSGGWTAAGSDGAGAAAGTSRESRDEGLRSAPPGAPRTGSTGEPGMRLLWEGAPPAARGGKGASSAFVGGKSPGITSAGNGCGGGVPHGTPGCCSEPVSTGCCSSVRRGGNPKPPRLVVAGDGAWDVAGGTLPSRVCPRPACCHGIGAGSGACALGAGPPKNPP